MRPNYFKKSSKRKFKCKKIYVEKILLIVEL